jgi:hypothetical protein
MKFVKKLCLGMSLIFCVMLSGCVSADKALEMYNDTSLCLNSSVCNESNSKEVFNYYNDLHKYNLSATLTGQKDVWEFDEDDVGEEVNLYCIIDVEVGDLKLVLVDKENNTVEDLIELHDNDSYSYNLNIPEIKSAGTTLKIVTTEKTKFDLSIGGWQGCYIRSKSKTDNR